MENSKIVQSVCLVTIDHYMCNPIDGLDLLYSEFWGTQIVKVPVLRVFGSTLDGNVYNIQINFNQYLFVQFMNLISLVVTLVVIFKQKMHKLKTVL